jgi:beta-glucosidase
VKNGCDLNCGCTYNDLVVAVQSGLITETEIEVSVRRLLATKFKLGLFDPPAQVPWSGLSSAVVDCEKHRALAREAAVESIVLLKNNGVLPLRADHESLLVTGPTAASVPALLGNYYGFSPRLVTLAEGILERAPESCRVVYRMGCPLSSPMAPGVNYTFGTAAENEITIAVLGLDPSLEGEEGDTVASPSGGDRDLIELPAVQLDFLTRAPEARAKTHRRPHRRQCHRRARSPRARRCRPPRLVSRLRRRPRPRVRAFW